MTKLALSLISTSLAIGVFWNQNSFQVAAKERGKLYLAGTGLNLIEEPNPYCKKVSCFDEPLPSLQEEARSCLSKWPRATLKDKKNLAILIVAGKKLIGMNKFRVRQCLGEPCNSYPTMYRLSDEQEFLVLEWRKNKVSNAYLLINN